MYKLPGSDGSVQFAPSISYLMVDAAIRLYSPQTNYQSFGGSGEITSEAAISHMGPDQHGVCHDIIFPLDVQGSNVPMLHDVSCTDEERESIGPHLRSCYAGHSLNFALADPYVTAWYPQFDPTAYDVRGYSFEFDTSGIPDVSAPSNVNLINAQKELLRMSWIYGISMHRLQELMRPSLVEDADGNKKYLELVLKSVFKSTSTCDIP